MIGRLRRAWFRHRVRRQFRRVESELMALIPQDLHPDNLAEDEAAAVVQHVNEEGETMEEITDHPRLSLSPAEQRAWSRWHRRSTTGEVLEHKERHGVFPVIIGGGPPVVPDEPWLGPRHPSHRCTIHPGRYQTKRPQVGNDPDDGGTAA